MTLDFVILAYCLGCQFVANRNIKELEEKLQFYRNIQFIRRLRMELKTENLRFSHAFICVSDCTKLKLSTPKKKVNFIETYNLNFGD
jgi:hypothetical protein